MSVELRCLAECGSLPADVDMGQLFVFDGEPLTVGLATLGGIVLRGGGEARAAELLAGGATKVFLGEAVLRDAETVARLAAAFGAERVGVHVPARRMEVGWSFDTVSNADFSVVSPSLAEPAWEILRADGSRSGVQVHWWLGEMLKRGVAEALVQVDVRDDADLNLCAGLVEEFGGRIWLAPLDDAAPMLADWVAYGRVSKLALAPALFARRDALLPAAQTGAAVEAA
ncbi:MAG TPA: hypothetical protein VJ673_02090 [Aromatoleum sp.]|uniref:hypothetical protein n=1 Tax=Aromatoleum sp. TaxID=2307007 RepID=UPI002B4640C0|nr:hypothetical protein [Aromatoleum sp.]HJV24440.1 hypothetical protein [Aromatoleum sp.]